ncbi:MAG: ADP-ribosylglycohydrolase family protein, partial [Lachnospiraceae bacterium]|nr:ADP-ribosylglycohydrolase family protein [Lachnospiraceae bacterium]
GSVHFREDQTKELRVRVRNVNRMHQQQWVKITIFLPDGSEAIGGSSVQLPLNNNYLSEAETTFRIDASAYRAAVLEGVIDVSLVGRHSSGDIKFMLTREFGRE